MLHWKTSLRKLYTFVPVLFYFWRLPACVYKLSLFVYLTEQIILQIDTNQQENKVIYQQIGWNRINSIVSHQNCFYQKKPQGTKKIDILISLKTICLFLIRTKNITDYELNSWDHFPLGKWLDDYFKQNYYFNLKKDSTVVPLLSEWLFT